MSGEKARNGQWNIRSSQILHIRHEYYFKQTYSKRMIAFAITDYLMPNGIWDDFSTGFKVTVDTHIYRSDGQGHALLWSLNAFRDIT